jgi:hypothetical protein
VHEHPERFGPVTPQQGSMDSGTSNGRWETPCTAHQRTSTSLMSLVL